MQFLQKLSNSATSKISSLKYAIFQNKYANYAWVKQIIDKLRLYLDYYTSTNLRFSENLRAKFFIGIMLNLVVFSLAIRAIQKPTAKLIAPFVKSSTQMASLVDQSTIKRPSFAYIPGWSTFKVSRVDVNGADIFSFYDMPVSGDGMLGFNTTGYQILRSQDTANLVQQIHNQHKKVLFTVSNIDDGQIANILNNSSAQQTLIGQSIAIVQVVGLDGVNIDFESDGNMPASYKSKFTQFVSYFSSRIHQSVPNTEVTVSLSNTLNTMPMYDSEQLSQSSDQVFMMADTFAVPETQNGTPVTPVFIGNSSAYWQSISTAINTFTPHVQQEKVATETAWYGNGYEYPLYTPKSTPQSTNPSDLAQAQRLTTPLSSQMINRLVSTVPANAQPAARSNLPYIAEALDKEGILNTKVLAYAMATIEHETAGTFQPLEEYSGRRSARRLGYEGGTDYFGRGFIQLTHLRNYEIIGQRIGMGDQLVQHPELAGTPEVAAKVLAAFFKDNNVANLASTGDFIDARTPVNPDYWAGTIAQSARKYLADMG